MGVIPRSVATRERSPGEAVELPECKRSRAALGMTTFTFLTYKETHMLLATTTIADFDSWMKVFGTTSAEKRKKYGSKGAMIFRDPNEADRVWVIFDWDQAGWQNFVSDPEVPPMLKAAGHKSKAQSLTLAAECEA